jgi:hypothetical protein
MMGVKRNLNPDAFLAEVLTTAEAAEFLRVSPDTLKLWRKRAQRRGPPYVKVGRRLVRYLLEDLTSYLAGQVIRPGV